MADITVFREYSLFGILVKSRIYANGKLVAKIGNCSVKTFSLPQGDYDLYARNPQFPIPFRKKDLLRSNTIKMSIEDDQEYHLNLCPHPLFWYSRHRAAWYRPFTPIECLLLLKQDAHFQENITGLNRIGKQIQDEMKHFKYHPVSLALIIALSLFAIISNIHHPNLYATGDGIAWGFLFGISSLIGLFSGRMNKQMMAMGWEYKILLYTAFGALMILFFIPQSYRWQSGVYFFSVLVTCFWAYFCFKRWKEKKKGLDNIGKRELALEQGF